MSIQDCRQMFTAPLVIIAKTVSNQDVLQQGKEEKHCSIALPWNIIQ